MMPPSLRKSPSSCRNRQIRFPEQSLTKGLVSIKKKQKKNNNNKKIIYLYFTEAYRSHHC